MHNSSSRLRRTFIIGLTCLISACLSLPSAAADKQALRFGLHPYANPAAVYQSFRPLVEALAKRSGHPITIDVAPNYTSHVRRLGEGKIDLAFVGPSPYVKANDRYHSIELLARLNIENDSGDQTVIIAKHQSPVTKLADLKGKTFAFGDYQSFGSHFMPRYLLRQSGVAIWDLMAYDYVMGHDNVIRAVLHGDFDAGAVRNDVFQNYPAREALKIIAGPIAIPPHAIVCRQDLPTALKASLRQILLDIKDPQVLKAIDPRMTGFSPVADQDFNLARQVIRDIETP
jgi:phosphonate transport system substrate-binding protein